MQLNRIVQNNIRWHVCKLCFICNILWLQRRTGYFAIRCVCLCLCLCLSIRWATQHNTMGNTISDLKGLSISTSSSGNNIIVNVLASYWPTFLKFYRHLNCIGPIWYRQHTRLRNHKSLKVLWFSWIDAIDGNGWLLQHILCAAVLTNIESKRCISIVCRVATKNRSCTRNRSKTKVAVCYLWIVCLRRIREGLSNRN